MLLNGIKSFHHARIKKSDVVKIHILKACGRVSVSWDESAVVTVKRPESEEVRVR